MLALRNGERLYLTSWNYNCARVMTRLAEIVEEKGGRVKPNCSMLISNRSIDEKIRKIEAHMDGMRRVGEKLGKEIDLSKCEAEIAELKATPNEPIEVTQGTYVIFVLNNTYYAYYADDNPFFDFMYIKTPVVDGKRSRNICGEADEEKVAWHKNELFEIGCTDEIIRETAESLFNLLIEAKPSVKRLDSRRCRVPNVYGNGYHYERIYEKERFEKLDF